MKIYVNDDTYQTYLNNTFKNAITLVHDKKDAEVVITGRFDAPDYHDHLKAVIIPYTGHDGIDVKALKHHNVPLFNTTVHSKFVAEKAMQLAHALLGNVVAYHNNLKKGDWSNRNNPNRTPWVSLFNRHIGIYGYGRIGQFIHEMLKPFNPKVYVIDRGKDYPEATPLKDLEALVTSSDIVFIAAPLTKATENVFDASIIQKMQDSYLINVGRGPIINEDALYQGLKANILKGFASDVWYQYPKKDTTCYPSKHPIHEFNHVVLSPHCGGHTTNSKQAMMEKVADHIDNILNNNYSEALDLESLI